jgi:TPR repeat protein
MYASGQGVQKDLVEAYAWLHRAGAAGVIPATTYIQRIAARMEPALLAQANGYAGVA